MPASYPHHLPQRVHDGKMAQELTRFIGDAESDLLFHHSIRVYLFDALTGLHKDMTFYPELLYLDEMFHDIAIPAKSSPAIGQNRLVAVMERRWVGGSRSASVVL